MLQKLKELTEGMESSVAKLTISKAQYRFLLENGQTVKDSPQPNGGHQVLASDLHSAVKQMKAAQAVEAASESLENLGGEETLETGAGGESNSAPDPSETDPSETDTDILTVSEEEWLKPFKAGEQWAKGDRAWVKEDPVWFGEILEVSEKEAMLQTSSQGEDIKTTALDNLRQRKPSES